MLFSVLSDWAMTALHPIPVRDTVANWKTRGIYDIVGNAQLDTIDVDKDYYKNVWLTRAFLERSLSPEFTLVDYVPGFHFYQDLVVAVRQ